MNAKVFLMQYRRAAARAETIEDELRELKEKRDELQGFQVEERVQTSHIPDKIGALIAQTIDLEADLMDAKADALQIMMEVDAVINKVPDPSYQLLLHDRYIRLHILTHRAAEALTFMTASAPGLSAILILFPFTCFPYSARN